MSPLGINILRVLGEEDSRGFVNVRFERRAILPWREVEKPMDELAKRSDACRFMNYIQKEFSHSLMILVNTCQHT